jgi:hypothetical protein
MRRANKYGAVKTTVDNIVFDSKAEAKRYQDLKLLQRAGEISELCADKSKLRFPLVVEGQRVGFYVGDFSYVEKGVRIIEDVKGFKTPVYQLKKKLMQAIHGISIREIN